MQLFYSQDIDSQYIHLADQEAQHCSRVLRYDVGQTVYVTDGLGSLYKGEISSSRKRQVTIHPYQVVRSVPRPTQMPTLAIGILKTNTRWEWMLEKAVEIGVQDIIPLLCQHGERFKINHDRSMKILISAMKQSQRLWLPNLHSPIKATDYLSQCDTTAQSIFLAHYLPDNAPLSRYQLEAQTNPTLLIGPEGDFSQKEIEIAKSKNMTFVNLSGARLRSETAALVGLTTLHDLIENKKVNANQNTM